MARDLKLRLKKEELRRLYLEQKKSLEDIARIYGVSRVAVWKYCRNEGLTMRTRSEARLEAQKNGKVPQNYYYINDRFFNTWNNETAYILGLLITDGCLSRAKKGSYRISLCLNDKELLKKVADAMGSKHAITLSRHQEGLHVFIFGRRRLVEDLMILGMKPRKSLDIKFPDVPTQYLRDFIRGVFDGDGCVYYRTGSKTKLLNTSFVSASKNFIYGLESALHILGMAKRKIYEYQNKNMQTKNIYYTLRYCHKESLELFKIMYEGLKNNLYLERKYDKFKSVIGQ